MSAHPTASSISRYRFVHRLAVGGMAEIYAADAAGALNVTRRVAIKRIIPHHAGDAEFVRMFLNEARLASTLQHPNIVQTLDILDDRGKHLIVMELLDGLNLLGFRKIMYARRQRFTPAQSLYIIDRVLSGLHYAHQRSSIDGQPLGVVHRDVSPHNVVITTDGGVKLVDFGVAKAEQLLDRKGTESGVVKGKVLYMSPEQCQGQELDRRADLWSAGVLLYILLTGQAPFRGKNPYDTMRSIIHDYPIAPSQVVPTLTAELDAVVLSAMAKNPEQRFATARDMQRAVSDVIRRNSLYLTDVEFTSFVEDIYSDWERPEPDTVGLPDDVVIAEGGTEQVARFGATATGNGNAVIAETEHAVVERTGGLTLLKLRGVIDERFEPDSIRPHLKGTVLIDSEAVRRITSYGIRGLLRLVQLDTDTQLFHMNCSVAFVQQLGMVRGILGGGKVISYQLPYIDPMNGNAFVELISGKEGREALARQRAPQRQCPGFLDRLADFDEDDPSYLCFIADFLTEPPPLVRALVTALELEERQVEMSVTATGTNLFIRRPLDESYRWRSMLSGLEGDVNIDMEATPSWTDEGVRKLMNVLSRSSDSITSLTLQHMPSPLCGALPRFPNLAVLLTDDSTVRVHARCENCLAPRRVFVLRTEVPRIDYGVMLDGQCRVCGGPLQANEDLRSIAWSIAIQDPAPEPLPGERQPMSDVSGIPRWIGILLVLALFGLMILCVLIVWAKFLR